MFRQKYWKFSRFYKRTENHQCIQDNFFLFNLRIKFVNCMFCQGRTSIWRFPDTFSSQIYPCLHCRTEHSMNVCLLFGYFRQTRHRNSDLLRKVRISGYFNTKTGVMCRRRLEKVPLVNVCWASEGDTSKVLLCIVLALMFRRLNKTRCWCANLVESMLDAKQC